MRNSLRMAALPDFCNLMTLLLFTALDDFSGPAESTRFPLGSIIPIMASVVQETHQPLLLLLEECVAATTSELYPESTTYPIISNKGYSWQWAFISKIYFGRNLGSNANKCSLTQQMSFGKCVVTIKIRTKAKVIGDPPITSDLYVCYGRRGKLAFTFFSDSRFYCGNWD